MEQIQKPTTTWVPPVQHGVESCASGSRVVFDRWECCVLSVWLEIARIARLDERMAWLPRPQKYR